MKTIHQQFSDAHSPAPQPCVACTARRRPVRSCSTTVHRTISAATTWASFGPGAQWTANFNEHAFRVSAVPEPAQLLMLLAGGAAVFSLRRRQQALGGAQ